MMYRDLIPSVFLHIALFIYLGISSIFFYKKIELHQINVSLVDPGALLNNSYTPLNIKPEVPNPPQKISEPLDANSSNLTNLNQDGKKLTNKDSLSTPKPKQVDKVIATKELATTAYKDNIVNHTEHVKSTETSNKLVPNDVSTDSKNKDLFVSKIISGLDKGELTQNELLILNNQLKGCWYGKGGYSDSEDLTVELLLTMNADATISNIEVINPETYNTPVRKVFLDQVLRALNDPKCKPLKLPANSYNNWKLIHIIFDPKG